MSEKKRFIFCVTLTNKQYRQIQKLKTICGVKSDAGLLQTLIEKSNLGFIKLD
jgi:hypothetical protein